jgi:hypothetical protein
MKNLESLTLPNHSSTFGQYIKVSGTGDDCLATWMARCYTSRWLSWLLHPFVGSGGGSGNDWEVTPTVVLAVKSH